MTALRKEAIDLIESIPDTKIAYVIAILRNIAGKFNSEKAEKLKDPSSAYKRLLRYKSTINNDFDYKAEIAKARDEKYANSI